MSRAYLGDGLYVRDEGYMITLSTERHDGEHFVCLEPEVLSEFIRFLEQSRGLKITVTRIESKDKSY
jgi:hypothetical protein